MQRMRVVPLTLWVASALLACSSRSKPTGDAPVPSISASVSSANAADLPGAAGPASASVVPSARASEEPRWGAPVAPGREAPASVRAACEAARVRAESAIIDPTTTGSGLAGSLAGPSTSGPYGRCFAAGRGAWLLDVEAPDNAPKKRAAPVRIWASYVTPKGAVLRATDPVLELTTLPDTRGVQKGDIGPIVDWDEDGAPDLMLTVTWLDYGRPDESNALGTPRSAQHAFSFRGNRVEPLSVPVFLASHHARPLDVDGDGRVDFTIHRRWQHSEPQRNCHWPKKYGIFSSILTVLAHNIGRGKFSATDEVARAHARQNDCPWPTEVPLLDDRDGASEQRIRCARLLGIPATEVAARVKAEYVKLPPKDHYNLSREQCMPLTRLLEAAAWRPEELLTAR